jgi:flavin reductase (DIM6/NTAB) family NADH-FMN oxidoreductase RutF
MSDSSQLRQLFLEGMSHAAATVNIVTTDGPAGRYGVTVSAMSSVSADSAKPSLLVCVHHQSRACEAIQRNGVFCVNVLRDDQSEISDAFAGRIKTADGDKFSCGTWTREVTGAPRIVDPLVAFDCRLEQNLRYGTHRIFIGEVEHIFVEKGGSPLIYANRAYGRPTKLESNATPHTAASTPAGTLRLGSLVTLAPYLVPQLVARYLEANPEASVQLLETTHTRLIDALTAGQCDVALTYGMELGERIATETLTEIPAYVLLPAGHKLARQARVSLKKLAREPMILLDLPMSREYFIGLFRADGLGQLRDRARSRRPRPGLCTARHQARQRHEL